MPTDDPDIDQMPDVGPWIDGDCPTCGGPVRRRQTNLRAVSRMGDENLAEKECRPVAGMSDFRFVDLLKRQDELLDVLRAAVRRVEIANAEGNPILSAWLPSARAAIANAEPQLKGVMP